MQELSNKTILRIKGSGLFDKEWYLNKYPDVTQIGMDPLLHFIKYGGKLRRDPGPNFNSSFYFDTRPGIESKGFNPLVHFINYKSGKTPSAGRVLGAVNRVAAREGYQKAIALASQNLNEELKYTLNILEANNAILKGDEASWLLFLNNYLKEFNINSLFLEGSSGGVLNRLKPFEKDLIFFDDEKKISVIMPAWNSENTIEFSVRSILNQTWRNLELIIIDDASEDNTWSILNRIASTDSRVKVLRNNVNVGPYVSKNIGLENATGDYITGHDADDWALPQRLERHISLMRESKKDIKASLTYMLRIRPNGFFSFIDKINGFCFDGVARRASISCLFETKALREKLGYWDSVRFGADSEMISRAQKVFGDSFVEFQEIGMLCLDLETSLTNHPVYGIDKVNGISDSRKMYKEAWMKWQDLIDSKSCRLNFPHEPRFFGVSESGFVSVKDIIKNLNV